MIEEHLNLISSAIKTLDEETAKLEKGTLFSDEYRQQIRSLAEGRAVLDSERHLPALVDEAWQEVGNAEAEVSSASDTASNPGLPASEVLPLLSNQIALSQGSGKAFNAAWSAMRPSVRLAAGLYLAGELQKAGIRIDIEWNRAVQNAQRELAAKVANDPAVIKAQQRLAAAHDTMGRTVAWAQHLDKRFGRVSPTIRGVSSSVSRQVVQMPNGGLGVVYQRQAVEPSLAVETDEQRRRRLHTDRGSNESPLFGQTNGETDASRRSRLYGGRMADVPLFNEQEKD